MRAWEPVEISVNKIDVADILTTSYGTSDGPLVGGGDILGGSESNDVTGGIKD